MAMAGMFKECRPGVLWQVLCMAITTTALLVMRLNLFVGVMATDHITVPGSELKECVWLETSVSGDRLPYKKDSNWPQHNRRCSETELLPLEEFELSSSKIHGKFVFVFKFAPQLTTYPVMGSLKCEGYNLEDVMDDKLTINMTSSVSEEEEVNQEEGGGETEEEEHSQEVKSNKKRKTNDGRTNVFSSSVVANCHEDTKTNTEGDGQSVVVNCHEDKKTKTEGGGAKNGKAGGNGIVDIGKRHQAYFLKILMKLCRAKQQTPNPKANKEETNGEKEAKYNGKTAQELEVEVTFITSIGPKMDLGCLFVPAWESHGNIHTHWKITNIETDKNGHVTVTGQGHTIRKQKKKTS